MPDFSEIELVPALQRALEVAAYVAMTPVQAASLPAILAGRDVVAQAKTGSGKTAAFALGLLSRVDAEQTSLQGLVLCPTRELAEQVSREIRRLACFVPNLKVLTACGGIPVRVHVAALARAPHIVVGTPGRVLDLLQKGALRLAKVAVLVLDEADRMLDMGFHDDIASITEAIPGSRQTLLYSATYSDPVRAISKRFQRDALDVTLTAVLSSAEVKQTFYEVEHQEKLGALQALLNEHRAPSTVVFCNTRRTAGALASTLVEQRYAALALHGELDQREREEVLLCFANASATILIATDVAARGLDIKGLPLVINYDLASDPDVHLHRIGRTGRAGTSGQAISLCSHHERFAVAAAIEAEQGEPLLWRKLPPPASGRRPPPAEMATLVIGGGRQDKLRPGDLLGALTGEVGLSGHRIGKIDIFPTRSYVAVQRAALGEALRGLRAGRIKGRRFRVHALETRAVARAGRDR